MISIYEIERLAKSWESFKPDTGNDHRDAGYYEAMLDCSYDLLNLVERKLEDDNSKEN